MNILFWNYVRDFIKTIFIAIIIALIIAGVIWFGGFIFDAPIPFAKMYRHAYIALLLVDLVAKMCGFVFGWTLLRQTMKRFDVSKKDAADALFRYNLHKKANFATWSITQFKVSLHISRSLVKIFG